MINSEMIKFLEYDASKIHAAFEIEPGMFRLAPIDKGKFVDRLKRCDPRTFCPYARIVDGENMFIFPFRAD